MRTDKLKIYEVIERETETSIGYYTGFEELRDFAKDCINNRWDTDFSIDDLKDEKSVIKFIEEEWYGEVRIIVEIDLKKYL
jgi:hypothetical protein